MLRLASRGFALALTICALTLAPRTTRAAGPPRPPTFLSPQTLDIGSLLPPPPEKGSERDRADFRIILGHQTTRTEVDCSRGSSMVGVSLNSLFGGSTNLVEPGRVQQWSALFEMVRNDTDYFVQMTKRHWKRPRPYMSNPAVNPCVKREVTAAYPSGHAAIGRVFGLLLADLIPERRDQLLEHAARVGMDRVVVGVHHPSDIEAGQVLGGKVHAALMQCPKFRRAFSVLKAQRDARNSPSQ